MTTTDLRCPECSSLVRPGVSWCSLCHADVRSEEEKEAARAEVALLQGDVDTPTEPVTVAEPARGRHARPSTLPIITGGGAGTTATTATTATTGTTATTAPATQTRTDGAAPESADAVDAPTGPATSAETDEKIAELKEAGIDVDGMLQMLASSSAADPLNGLVDRLSSKGSRAIAVLVCASALTAIGIGLMFLLGWIFG